MERQLTSLVELLGAEVEARGDLGGLVARWPGRGPAFNHLGAVRWPSDGWETRLDRTAAAFLERHEPPAIVVAEGLTQPPDLGARLVERGWISLVRETVFWTRRAAVVPHLDPRLRIEAVTDRSAAEYELVERRIFGLSDAEAAERVKALEATIAAGRQRAYLLRLAGDAVATARLAVSEEGLGALHGIGVVRDRRRQGYGTMLTTVATRAGLATGQGLVWLSVAAGNEPARRLYEALDYRPAYDWQLIMRPDRA
ncbi:MAG: GNAT family N-acetyltransferase [Chloroflexi bacterium]|nr:GNAT family N-acetyltransferase [Chloroflexota bacterium]